MAELNAEYARIILIANSIGAYFSMCAGIDRSISEAFFISPIVDMEKLICEMMRWASVTEAELKEKGVIHTAFGEDLSWAYLCYVRAHPPIWTAPTPPSAKWSRGWTALMKSPPFPPTGRIVPPRNRK